MGTDHTVSIVDTVTTDDYTAGATNYVCVRDDNSPERRYALTAKQFKLEPSIAVEPAEVNSGDEVTVKLRDFEVYNVMSVKLAGTEAWTGDTDIDGTGPDTDTDDFEIKYTLGARDLTFEMPGGLSGNIEISVDVGGTSKETTITVVPSSLMLSVTEVAPNQSIIISGTGFKEESYINVEDITIDDIPLVVDESGVERMTVEGETITVVETTSSGTFSASVNVWTVDKVEENPALDAGTYKIEVEDVEGFSGSTMITILAPTLTVTPTTAGPRDYIVISGENWPVSTSDDDREVEIEVDERDRNSDIDSTGRFNLEYQLKATIPIGTVQTIKVTYQDKGDRGNIEEEITFIVPSSNVIITPAAAAPGETIDLEMTGMPIHRLVDDVIIDGADRLGNANFNTDADGSITVTGVLVPYADPGFFPVRIKVGEETAVVQLEILAEPRAAGAASALPDAVMDLGDSVVRIFHFNTASKVWTFYDPRPEFDGLNTLTELANGQPYWILVSENVENVVLNGRTRNLTCVGGDCWNQLVW